MMRGSPILTQPPLSGRKVGALWLSSGESSR